jgi:hypothetical protein
MTEMKIGHNGNSPFVEINFFLNEEAGNQHIKLPMSKMWYNDIIYEIEKISEEEKKKAEKHLHEDDRKMMTQSFDMYSKLNEISNKLRKDLESESEVATFSEASGDM